MKPKWKIKFLVLFAILFLITSFFMLNLEGEKALPPSPPASNSSLSLYSPLGKVDKLLDKMEFGIIAFNAPTNINIDDSPQIQLILSLSETIEQLKQSITEEGEKIAATIRISDRMKAHLSGYMFQIIAITPETQAVSKHQQTEWKWEIYPKEKGRHKLHLTLTALLEIDGHSTPRTIKTFSKIIDIKVTATQEISIFFKDNWQWLWTTILIPIAGWLWTRRKKQLKSTSD